MALYESSRELSISEILSESFGLYFSRFGHFFAPLFLTNLANILLRQFFGNLLPPFDPPRESSDSFFSWLINYVTTAAGTASVFILASLVISMIAYGSAVKCSSDLLEGGDTRLKDSFKLVFSRIPSIMASTLITGVLFILGIVLFVVPGIIVAVMFSLAIQVIMAEGLGPIGSLRRSRRLVSRRWGKTLLVIFSVALMMIVAGIAADFIPDFFPPLRAVIEAIITTFILPLYPIALTRHYYSLRTRERIEGPSPFEPASPAAHPAPAIPAGFQLKFCYKCGEKLVPGTFFCPECGNRVKP